MIRRETLVLVAFVLGCEFVGVIGGISSVSALREWYPALAKPWFNPPNWIFGPVWTVLYLMNGLAAYYIWRKRGRYNDGLYRAAMIAFGAQLLLNLLWSPVFFGMRSLVGGLIVIILLWLAIIITLWRFALVSHLATWLLVPYLLWVTFATVLNASLVVMNH